MEQQGNGNETTREDLGLYQGPRAVDPEPPDDHSDDPQYMSRTRFLTGVALVTGGVITAAILVPVVGFAVAPTVQGEDWKWVDVGPYSAFPTDKTTSIAVSGPSPEANRRVFVRNRDDELIPIWNRCAHLGCPVAYASGGDNFSCPCHGGAYNSRGLVVGGPPPRPLDRMDVKIVNAQGKDVWIRGQRLSAANPQPKDRVLIGKAYSIDQQEQPFDLHPPGDPVTGTLSYLFPFTTS